MRRRDCKVDFICFCKIPQSFFVFKKMTVPFTREPLEGNRIFNPIAFTQKQTPSQKGVCCVIYSVFVFNLIFNLNKLKHAFV